MNLYASPIGNILMHQSIDAALRILVLFFLTSLPFYLLFYVWRPRAWDSWRISQPGITARSRPIKEGVMTLINMMLLVLPIALVTLVEYFTGYTARYDNVSDYGWPYFFFLIIFVLLVIDAEFYWVHVWFHRNRGGPHRAHMVHHQFANPTPFAGWAFHIVESIALTLPHFVFFLLLPWHPAAMIAVQVIVMSWNAFLHLGYDPLPNWWHTHPITKWIAGSRYHCGHHHDINHNFALYFTFWDKAMGTERPEKKE